MIDSQSEQKLSTHRSSIPFLQFNALATILANVVLPTPLMPVNKKAFDDLFILIELNIACAISS